MKSALRRLLALGFLGLFFWGMWTFVNANLDPTRLYFLEWRTREFSLGLLILLAFFLGVFLSAFIFFSTIMSARLEVRRLRRENDSLQKVLSERVGPSLSTTNAS